MRLSIDLERVQPNTNINQFLVSAFILYPLETPENQGYKMRTLA